MSEPRPLIERLRDYDTCHDGDVDEAADMLEFLLGQFQASSLMANNQHYYRFRTGWPWTHATGPNIETAVRNAMAEQKRGFEELKERQT